MTHRRLLLGLCGLLIPMRAHAVQSTTQGDPLTVAGAAFAAVDSQDWARLLQLVHPLALANFKLQQLETLDPIARLDSSELAALSPEERAGFAEHDSSMQRFRDFYLNHVYHLRTVEEFRGAPAESLLVRYFAYIRAAYVGRRDSLEPPDWVPRLLGTVYDGDSVAFVIVRERMPPVPSRSEQGADFLTLRRFEGRWRTMLNGGLIYGGDGGIAFWFSDSDEQDFYQDVKD
jgi:hypothetical protein